MSSNEPAVQHPAAADSPKGEEVILEGEALEETLRQYFEYYLSREYLAVDSYLVSQMNGDMYLPVSILAAMVPVKADPETIINSLRNSTQLTLSEDLQLVKPNFKITRNTVILRDIPTTTNIEEVKAIFSGEQSPPVVGIRPDIGDCWFVTFDSEEHALQALEYVRNQKFRDNYVKARIKSENLLRSLYQPASAPMAMTEGDAAMNLAKMGQYNYYPSIGYRSWMQVPQAYQGAVYDPNYRGEYEKEAGGHQGDRRRGGGRGGPRKEYRNKYGNTGGQVAGSNTGYEGQPIPTRGSGGVGGGGGEDRKRRARNRSRTEGQGKSTPTSHTPPQLGLANFPPLLSSTASTKQKPTGYVKDYAKFTRDELIDIVTAIQVPAQRPSSLSEEPCIAVLSEPNTKLAVTSQKEHKDEGSNDAASRAKATATGTPAAANQGGKKSQGSQAPAQQKEQPRKNSGGNAQQQQQRKDKTSQAHGEAQKSTQQQTRKVSSPAASRSPQAAAQQQGKRKEETGQPSSPTVSAPAPVAPAPVQSPAATPAPGPALPTYAQAVSKPKEVTV